MISLSDLRKVYRSRDREVTALDGVDLSVREGEVYGVVGRSGAGKSTLIRCLNRMNDLIPGAEVTGTLTYHGQDLYGSTVDAVEVRKRIGMVFQKPNPFPKSIYENIAFGPRVLGRGPRQAAAEADEALRPACLEGLERYAPALKVRKVAGAGHWIPHEKPKEVADAMRRFVGD